MKVRSFVLIALAALAVASCSQNMEVVNSGERLEDSPRPVADPNAAPLARQGDTGGAPQIPPFVKAYFMHMWVEALYSTPGNKHPKSELAVSAKGPGQRPRVVYRLSYVRPDRFQQNSQNASSDG